MKVAIVGYDIEGKVSYEHFKARDAEITICDQNTDLVVPDGVHTQLSETYLDNLDQFDVIVRTAGLYPGKILAKNPTVADKITSQTNIFFKHSPTKNIIGVTGTKGKGTTSSLIAAMLEKSGKHVRLGGNIGVPPLSFIDELTPDSWVILELSSFQLIDLRYSPHIAVCLMVESEHMDWHEDMEEYIAAKQQLFINQNSDDVAIYYSENDDSLSIADASEGQQIPYYEIPGAIIKGDSVIMHNQELCKTSELKLLGKHNWQNVCAAITAAWQVTQDTNSLHEVLINFVGLEHRLEFVKEINKVKYYDDSFGTTPATAIVAIESFTAPKILILGGSDKGAKFDELAKAVRKNSVRNVILIGERAKHIEFALKRAGYKNYVTGGNTMQEIVTQASELAEHGDVVLLSTACASYDMFKDYKDRGNQFKQSVLKLF